MKFSDSQILSILKSWKTKTVVSSFKIRVIGQLS